MRVSRLLLLLALSSTTTVKASRNGALNCLGGVSAPGSFHRPASGFTEGTIAEGGITVTIDGVELTPDVALDFFTSDTYVYNVTISTTSFFRGVMARIDGGDDNVDASETLTIVEGDQDLKENSFCVDDPQPVRIYTSRSTLFLSIATKKKTHQEETHALSKCILLVCLFLFKLLRIMSTHAHLMNTGQWRHTYLEQ